MSGIATEDDDMTKDTAAMSAPSAGSARPYYQQGGIAIYHGDCREILPSLGGVDCIVTSPPYNCGMDYGGHDDAMPVEEYFSAFEDWAHSISAAIRRGGFVIVNVPSWIGSRGEQLFAFEEYKAVMDRCLPFWDLVIWQKNPPNGTAWGNYPSSPRIRANHEWLLVYRAPGDAIGKSDISWQEWSRLTQSVWTINPALPMRGIHPATFPEELARRAVMLYSPAGSTVCDPFMGTGTTLVAARECGRRAIGIEVNERYCEAAANRLAQGVLF